MSLFGGLQTSVAGVTAQTNRLNTIGQNISNVNTTGYKAGTVAFETVLGEDAPASYVGGGVQSALRLNASQQGTIATTTSSTDLAIAGNGFFVVKTSSGDTALTRAGSFQRESDGTLVNTAGATLLGYAGTSAALTPVIVPSAATAVSVGTNGAVSFTNAGGTSTAYSVPLAKVRSPENLTALTADTYLANDASGAMQVATAGTAGLGAIKSTALEGSTTDLATELTNMIVTQRGYEANSKVMSATSDMLSKLSTL